MTQNKLSFVWIPLNTSTYAFFSECQFNIFDSDTMENIFVTFFVLAYNAILIICPADNCRHVNTIHLMSIITFHWKYASNKVNIFAPTNYTYIENWINKTQSILFKLNIIAKNIPLCSNYKNSFELIIEQTHSLQVFISFDSNLLTCRPLLYNRLNPRKLI